MPLTQLAPPYPIFTDNNGEPLDAGYLYFGEDNQNPETNPITVYYDRALTQPAAQPLRTSNGYVMRNGSPALIYAGDQFSITVRDKNGSLLIYSPTGYGIVPSISSLLLDNAAKNVSALLADTSFSYNTAISGTVQVAVGDILRTLSEGYAYEVAASGATDQDVTTAGGVKLYVTDRSPLGAKVSNGKTQSFIAGVVRSSAGTWALIDDATHKNIGVTSIGQSSLEVEINYTGGTSNGAFLAVPDETFALDGMTLGASSGTTQGRIRMAADLSLVLDVNSDVDISLRTGPFPAYHQNTGGTQVAATWNGTSKEIQVAHLPSVFDPIVGLNSVADATTMLVASARRASGFTGIALYAPLAGEIFYNGSAWQISSKDTVEKGTDADYSFTWNVAGYLTVTHPAVNDRYTMTVSSRATGYPVAGLDLGTTSFRIYFKDWAGAAVTVPDTSMRAYFYRGLMRLTYPWKCQLTLLVPCVRVDPNNVASASANIWFANIFNN